MSYLRGSKEAELGEDESSTTADIGPLVILAVKYHTLI
jgi:hypothetical protein